MDRRDFLWTLAAGTVASLTACSRTGPVARAGAVVRPVSAARIRSIAPIAQVVPAGAVDHLPGTGRSLALTIDDGTSTAVVGAYLDFIQASGVRLTFFPNGVYDSWTEHAPRLRPLVDSGQVQLGNHTWSHPDLRRLSDQEVASQISRNHDFLNNTYGIQAWPFFRPPYGSHDARVDQIARDHGYWVPVMWYGTLGDSTILTAEQIVANARRWFGPQRIVIGHANHNAVTHTYPQLLEIIRQSKLRTVTLSDVFNTR